MQELHVDIPRNILWIFQGVWVLKIAAKTNSVWSKFPLESAGIFLSIQGIGFTLET